MIPVRSPLLLCLYNLNYGPPTSLSNQMFVQIASFWDRRYLNVKRSNINSDCLGSSRYEIKTLSTFELSRIYLGSALRSLSITMEMLHVVEWQAEYFNGPFSDISNDYDNWHQLTKTFPPAFYWSLMGRIYLFVYTLDKKSSQQYAKINIASEAIKSSA